MPREFSRTRRVGEQIQRELAELIREEIKDPRLGFVTLSGVQVSRDLRHAKIYVTVLDEDHDAETTVKILNGATSFLRHALAHRMAIRTTPKLYFVYDVSVQQGARLSLLISQAGAEDKVKPEDCDRCFDEA